MSEASSTCGISGLPFTFQDEKGEERQVADGAFRNFLPAFDEHSITVKPFCAGVDMLGFTGDKADVGPSEYVPASFGVFPPPVAMLEHLYELGYQDMETWLDLHLEERAREVAQQAAEQVRLVRLNCASGKSFNHAQASLNPKNNLLNFPYTATHVILES